MPASTGACAAVRFQHQTEVDSDTRISQTRTVREEFTFLAHAFISKGLKQRIKSSWRGVQQRPVTEQRVCCIAVAGRDLPQLLAVLPRNSLVLGFHTNSFHSPFSPSFAIFVLEK